MHLKSALFLSILSASACLQAQNSSPLPDLVTQALGANQSIAARQHQVEQAEALARSASSPQNPELELAPGIGFTNSTFVLGQAFDLSGARAARARRIRAEVDVARAELSRAKLDVAGSVITSYAKYLSAQRSVVNAGQSVETARKTLETTTRLVTLGQAAAVQQTRAQIELNRAQQSLIRAEAEREGARATVSSLTGESVSAQLGEASWPAWGDMTRMSEGALLRRPERIEANAQLEVAGGATEEARRMGRPSLYAGVAADVWSLDRRPSTERNLGLQLRLSMRLFDRGENRNGVVSAQARQRSREAELRDIERRIALDIEVSTQQLAVAEQVARSYETGIIPQAEQMVRAMQAGLESGVVSFLELLEAQKTLVQLRQEASEATERLHLAQARYLTATVSIPGLEEKR